MKLKAGYTFDDVLLVPKYSTIKSRSNIDLSVDLGKIKLRIPIISANMKNITEVAMAKVIADLGGLALLHRFLPYKEILVLFQNIEPHYRAFVGCSVGIQDKDKDFITILAAKGCNILCIDVAHANNKYPIDFIKWAAKEFPNLLLIAGNVATREGVLRLADVGVDVVKCGIGPGSLCSTRVRTGNGVPQLTALEDCYLAAKEKGIKIIADGGCKNSGDLVKSLCFSNAVMTGSLLAGTDEAPGELISIEGKTYKQYAGSSTLKSNYVEGVSGFVACKGPVKKVVQDLLEGIRSGLSYQGANNLEELREDPEFILVSQAGLVENHPHNIFLKS